MTLVAILFFFPITVYNWLLEVQCEQGGAHHSRQHAGTRHLRPPKLFLQTITVYPDCERVLPSRVLSLGKLCVFSFCLPLTGQRLEDEQPFGGSAGLHARLRSADLSMYRCCFA